MVRLVECRDPTQPDTGLGLETRERDEALELSGFSEGDGDYQRILQNLDKYEAKIRDATVAVPQPASEPGLNQTTTDLLTHQSSENRTSSSGHQTAARRAAQIAGHFGGAFASNLRGAFNKPEQKSQPSRPASPNKEASSPFVRKHSRKSAGVDLEFVKTLRESTWDDFFSRHPPRLYSAPRPLGQSDFAYPPTTLPIHPPYSPATMASTSIFEGGQLPTLPAEWEGGSKENPNFKAITSLSSPVMRKIEPVGPQFLAYARRKRHGRTFSEDERIQAQSKVKKVEDDDSGEISEPEDPLMLARDAKDWKGQDHYAVLGLSKLRHRATPEQIKKAHRKKVLRHHPDKKAAAGQSDENDSFFKCIQRANEILLDPIKRRQFDSVDEAADVEPPTKKEMQKGNFYKKWNPVFRSEARFSNIQPVPMLGDDNSTKEEVEEFYNFWYNFDSWRTFEYLDEDVPDDNEGRDHKRHIEKKNANARRKRKTEDTARLRKVVDDAMSYDERIKKFRKEASANKNKKRIEKEAAAKKEAEEKQKAKEEEERKLREAEESAKAEKAESKKAKEAAKNAVKKNKRVLKGSVKDVNYFAAGGNASAAQVDQVLGDTELIMSKIDPDELADLASKLTLAGKDSEKVKGAFTAEAERLVAAGKVKEGELKVLKA